MEFYRRLYNLLLSSRYKVTFSNLDLLKAEGPKLLLPNHVSHLDPQLMLVITYEFTEMVPVAAGRFFGVPVIGYFLKRMEAIPVPSFKKGSRDIGLIRKIETDLIDAFKRGKSALIFPSGQLSTDGIERVFNKQSAHSMTSKLPGNVKVLGVRITGMWGSMWSKAWTGKTPKFLPYFLLGIFYFFANLFFFIPKRHIHVEYVDITEEAKEKAKGKRKEFNLYLEEFYNANGSEKPKFIRHLFYFPRIKNKVKTA